MLAVGHQVDVMHRLVAAAVGLVAHLDAAQVLHPAHALDAGHHEAQRIALLGAQHLAVLAVRDQHFAVLDHRHRDGAGHRRAVGALGEHEAAALVVGAAHVEHHLERHAGELAAREHAVGVLAGRHCDVAPFHAGVGAALDEVEARHRRQPHDLVHGEDLRGLQQALVGAVDHQPVLRRIDVPPALVMALEVQPARRDDAEQRLQRRERHRRLARLREARGSGGAARWPRTSTACRSRR